MHFRNQAALVLAFCALVDAVIPIPFTALFLIYVLIARPPFARQWMDRIYQE